MSSRLFGFCVGIIFFALGISVVVSDRMFLVLGMTCIVLGTGTMVAVAAAWGRRSMNPESGDSDMDLSGLSEHKIQQEIQANLSREASCSLGASQAKTILDVPWLGQANFRIDSGRRIHINGLHFENTREGVLEGDPAIINRVLLERLPEKVREIFWDSKATVILKPETEELPKYTFIAYLTCSLPVKGGESADFSRLLMGWFTNELEGTVMDVVCRAVKGIDWEQHAENFMY